MISIFDIYPFQKTKLTYSHFPILPPNSPLSPFILCLSSFCSNILSIYLIFKSFCLYAEHQQKEPVFISNKDVEPQRRKRNGYN